MQVYQRAKVRCPWCGDVEVPVEDVRLGVAELFYWVTKCPACAGFVSGRTNDGGVISALVTSGAEVAFSGVADEAAEWLARASS
jgi:hypothetical protein